MANHSYKHFSGYLINFQDNYRFFAVSYTGEHLDMYLDQFVKDQINMARSVYGDYYADLAREFAKELTFSIKRAA
jgi:hypothetical protein